LKPTVLPKKRISTDNKNIRFQNIFLKIDLKSMLIPKVFRSPKQNVLKNNELIESKNKKRWRFAARV
jgi:hypothetical protein